MPSDALRDPARAHHPHDHGLRLPIVRTVIVLKEPPPQPLGWMGAETELPLEECRALCGARVKGCTLHAMGNGEERQPKDNAVLCSARSSCPGGRAPTGVVLARQVVAPTEVAAWWAQLAELEALSVGSFLRLAHELAAHGAPPLLVRRARRAVQEEAGHAARASSVAMAHGAEVPPIPDVAWEVREMQTVALENEVEGCVHETWSAAQIAHQARHAPLPVRAVLAPIAREEASHAALARDVSRWIAEGSGAVGRRLLRHARAAARAELATTLERDVSPAMRDALGLPSADRAHALLTA